MHYLQILQSVQLLCSFVQLLCDSTDQIVHSIYIRVISHCMTSGISEGVLVVLLHLWPLLLVLLVTLAEIKQLHLLCLMLV